MRKSLAVSLILLVAPIAEAQNLLVNGDLESSPAFTYFDGSDPTVADDVPGWVFSLGSAIEGSYLQVASDTSTIDFDSACGPSGGAIQTAPTSRPAVTAGISYTASLTHDNYFAPSDSAYFIDWYDGGGSLLGSIGGATGDANGALTFEPYTQVFSVTGAAPANAASAAVRLTLGNLGYGGMTADNFSFSSVPEPGSLALALISGLSLRGLSRRRPGQHAA